MAMSEWLKDLNKTYSDSLNKIDKYNERINVSDATYNVNAFNMGKVRVEEQDKNESKLKFDLVERGVDLNRSLISNALDPNGKQYREKLFVDINKNLEARKMNPMTRWEFDNTLVKVKEAEDVKKKDNVVPVVNNNNDVIELTNVVDITKDKLLIENDSIINNRIAGLLGLFPKTTLGSENTMVVKPAVVFSVPKTYNNAWKNIQNKIYRRVPDLFSSLKYKIELEKERK